MHQDSRRFRKDTEHYLSTLLLPTQYSQLTREIIPPIRCSQTHIINLQPNIISIGVTVQSNSTTYQIGTPTNVQPKIISTYQLTFLFLYKCIAAKVRIYLQMKVSHRINLCTYSAKPNHLFISKRRRPKVVTSLLNQSIKKNISLPTQSSKLFIYVHTEQPMRTNLYLQTCSNYIIPLFTNGKQPQQSIYLQTQSSQSIYFYNRRAAKISTYLQTQSSTIV